MVFDSEGSYIENKETGSKLWLKDDPNGGGMFVLKMWVNKGQNSKLGFPRRGE